MVNGQWSMVNGQWSIYRISKIKFTFKNLIPTEIHSNKFTRENSLSLVFKKLFHNQRTFMLHYAQNNFCFWMKR